MWYLRPQLEELVKKLMKTNHADLPQTTGPDQKPLTSPAVAVRLIFPILPTSIDYE